MESVAVSFAKIIGHTAAGRQLLLPIALSVPEPLRSQNRRIYRPVMISNYRTPARAKSPLLPADASIVDGSGRTVWLAGLWGWDENEKLQSADAGDQARAAMHNIESILTSLGGTLANLVRVVIYVVCLEDDTNMGRAWEAYTDVMGEDGPPATLIGVTMLGKDPEGGPQALVEIESTAVLPA